MRASFGVVLVLAACSKSSDAPSAATTTAPGPTGTGPVEATPPAESNKPCPADALPPDRHFAADGVCVRVVAKDLGRLRQLHFTANGDLLGVTTDGVIHRFVDANHDGFFSADEITDVAKTGGNGNNAHVDGAFVYAGSPSGVKRFSYPAGGAGEDVVVGQPSDGHSFHTVHVYDGFLYVHSGSAGNATNAMSPGYDTSRSLVKRFDLSKLVPGSPFAWSSGEVATVGLRNMVGFTRAANGKLFGVVNGLDDISYQGVDVHDDNPGEQIVEVAMGKQYGYPFCFTAQRVTAGGQRVAPGTQLVNEKFGVHDDAWCAANSSQPATFVQAHSAPLDIAFFDAQPKGALPERWRNGAFVALHGSWDREPSTGYKVVWVPFDANGNAPMPTESPDGTTKFPYEVVFGGGKKGAPKDGSWSWSSASGGEATRPVGVAVSPIDGALYVSSDANGYVYRIAMP